MKIDGIEVLFTKLISWYYLRKYKEKRYTHGPLHCSLDRVE